MINKKSIILAVFCTVTSINSVIAVEAPQKQEQRFSPETIAKIKKVAFATGLSVAAIATIALAYRYGVRSDAVLASTSGQGDNVAKAIVDGVSANVNVPVGALAMTQDTNSPVSLKASLKALVVKWLNEHGVIVNAVSSVASAGVGFVGGSKLKAAKFAAKACVPAAKTAVTKVSNYRLYSQWAEGFAGGHVGGFADGAKAVLMKLPKSFGPNSTSGSARALWNAFGKYFV